MLILLHQKHRLSACSLFMKLQFGIEIFPNWYGCNIFHVRVHLAAKYLKGPFLKLEGMALIKLIRTHLLHEFKIKQGKLDILPNFTDYNEIIFRSRYA